MNDGPRKKENRDDTGDEKGLEYDEDQAVKEYEEYDEEEEYTEKDGDDRVQVSLLFFLAPWCIPESGFKALKGFLRMSPASLRAPKKIHGLFHLAQKLEGLDERFLGGL